MNGTEVTLTPSSNVIDNSNDEAKAFVKPLRIIHQLIQNY